MEVNRKSSMMISVLFFCAILWGVVTADPTFAGSNVHADVGAFFFLLVYFSP